MRKILFLLAIGLLFGSCSKDKNTQNANAVVSELSQIQEKRVEVLYFHGKQRCVSCRNIEQYSKEIIEQDFSQELKEGKIVFKIIDISKPENEAIADKYEQTWSALLINKISGDSEEVNDMTDFSFEHAKSDEKTFKKGIKEKIKSLL